MQKELTILIVEDNEALRLLIKRYLDPRDCVTHLARGSTQALEYAEHNHFDVFVVDIRLNEAMTGVDLLPALRRLGDHANTPALACTVHDSPHDRQQLLDAGFDGHLAKPFTEDTLWQAIQRLLKN